MTDTRTDGEVLHDEWIGGRETRISFGDASLRPDEPVAVSISVVKPTNPKDAVAFDKAPLHLVPASLKTYCAIALAEGAIKYGSWNWRAAGVRASVYVSALDRHMAKWFNGEEFDPVTGVPHLANAIACLAILVDGIEQENIVDDRPPRQRGLPHLVDKRAPTFVEKLRRIFGHMTPRHWTTNDNEEIAA